MQNKADLQTRPKTWRFVRMAILGETGTKPAPPAPSGDLLSRKPFGLIVLDEGV